MFENNNYINNYTLMFILINYKDLQNWSENLFKIWFLDLLNHFEYSDTKIYEKKKDSNDFYFFKIQFYNSHSCALNFLKINLKNKISK